MSQTSRPVDTIRAVEWVDGCVELLDQRRLPKDRKNLRLKSVTQVADAIKKMVVRGAPAIGITAAYGVVLAAKQAFRRAGVKWREDIEPDLERLAQARPTAANLHWAIERMRARFPSIEGEPEMPLLREARAIHDEDIVANRRMGKLGASLINPGARIITHCNTGSLATGGFGTALGVVRTAYADKRILSVYASETRPWLQGARLTAWELVEDKIPVSLIADGAAAYLMQQQSIDWVIVGADRIVANGDVANKIGTYNLAVAAKMHGVGFMVVAPSSTFDMDISTGGEIDIEHRSASELLKIGARSVAADGAQAWNPVFDITPASLVDYIVTEKGIIDRPTTVKVAAVIADG